MAPSQAAGLRKAQSNCSAALLLWEAWSLALSSELTGIPSQAAQRAWGRLRPNLFLLVYQRNQVPELLCFLPHLNPRFLAQAQLTKNQILSRQMTYKEHLKMLAYSPCKTTETDTQGAVNTCFLNFLHPQTLIQHSCYSKFLHLLPWAIFSQLPKCLQLK